MINYILDEFDIVANELAETGNCDKEMFQKQINIDLNNCQLNGYMLRLHIS